MAPHVLIPPLTSHVSSSPGMWWDQSVQNAPRSPEEEVLDKGRGRAVGTHCALGKGASPALVNGASLSGLLKGPVHSRRAPPAAITSSDVKTCPLGHCLSTPPHYGLQTISLTSSPSQCQQEVREAHSELREGTRKCTSKTTTCQALSGLTAFFLLDTEEI